MTLVRDDPTEDQSYIQILKSTLLIGGSSVLNVGFSIIRNKVVAVMLGPEGIGLMGVFNSIVDMAQTLASLGVPSSGVRQIAEAVGSGDTDKIARTASTLKRISLLLAILGALALAALALPVADLTFGDRQHVVGIALLSLAIFFRVVSGGQMALIQGMRRISSIAQINVFSAFVSTAITIPLIYLLGNQGIVPSIVAIAAATLIASWWYSRKLRADVAAPVSPAFRDEASALLKLGFVFMISGFLTVASAYAIRIIIMQADGVIGAGLYQAAWALGGLYAGFILQAMGTDFYPRLTAAAQDNSACNRMINEQAQVSILLAGPGVLATLTFAPVAMWLFYSPEFSAAVNLLRWICLGMMLRVIAWPMGYIILAKGRQAIFFWTDVAASLVHVGIAWMLVSRFGTVGAGAAFFGLYVWHSLLVYLIARRLSGFRWSSANARLVLIFLTSSAAVFAATQFLPLWQATALGSVAVLVSSLYSLRLLADLLPPAMLPVRLRNWVTRSA